MATKAMTKALHTVRVVEAVATLLVKDNRTIYANGVVLFSHVLAALGNAAPTDAALQTQCIERCAYVLARS